MMDGQFLQKFSDSAASPSADFKDSLAKELNIAGSIPVTKGFAVTRMQILIFITAAAATTIIAMVLAISRHQVSFVYEPIRIEVASEATQPEPAVKGIQSSVAENDNSGSESELPFGDDYEQSVVVQIPVVESEATVDESGLESEQDHIVETVVIDVCRDEYLISIPVIDRLASDINPPCADLAYSASFWNVIRDDQILIVPTSAPDATRSDNSINFEWGVQSPELGVQDDLFIAQWSASKRFDAGGYRVEVVADDGVRLFIDNVLVVNGWGESGLLSYSAKHILTEGLHDIRLEYYDVSGNAQVGLTIQQAR